MTFEFLCVTIFGLLFGIAFAFQGIMVFRSLLPMMGFFFGFAWGVQSLDFLFGVGFLGTLTSWVGGAIIGVIFGALSYLFFRFAIALFAGSLGYGIGVSIMLWIGLKPGFIVWLVGVIVGAALIVVTIKFKLEKYLVVVGTSIMGSALIITTLLSRAADATPISMMENPLRALFQESILLGLLFLVIIVAGSYVQLKTPAGSMWTEPPIRDYDPTKYDPRAF